ncbi:hypothetical protein HZS_2396 [Henneguya salminicola]|nr:hypothetical protein HZS_2396 [Henneguya salminicola]
MKISTLSSWSLPLSPIRNFDFFVKFESRDLIPQKCARLMFLTKFLVSHYRNNYTAWVFVDGVFL